MNIGKQEIPPKKQTENKEEEKRLNLESYFSGEKTFDELVELSFSATTEEEDIILKQWPNLIEKYPKEAYQFMELFAQNPVGTPRVFWDSVLSVITKPGLPPNLTGPILGQINVQFWYRPEEMKDILLEYLNFSDFKNIARTGALLEYLTFFIESSDEEDSFYEETVNYFEDVLDKKCKVQEGSYLLNIRAKQLLEKRTYRPQKEYAPFVITNGVYAMIKNKQLFLAKKEDFERIVEIMRKGEEARASGNVDLVRSSMRNIKELENYFSDSISDKLFLLNKPVDGDINDFAYLQRRSVRDLIQNEFNIKLSDLSIPEQFQVLQFIKYQDVSSVQRVKSFSDTFNITGFRTFLSVEQGGIKMGDKIITLGEKLPEGVAQKIFAKYGEIIDVVDNANKIIDEILPKEVFDKSQTEINEIKESMLVRAKDLLVTFYDKKENNPESLLKDLERYKSEVLLYADTYKKLKQSGKEIRLEDIKDTQITILSQEEKEKVANILWDITKANRPFIKDGTTEMENRRKNFYNNIENKKSDLYVLKHKEDILAFCSSTLDENGDIYVESLNVESEIKSSKVGGEFFPIVLEKLKTLGRDIYGHVHPGNSGILNYYERLGFQIKEVKENGELKYYEIRIRAEERVSIAA